MIQRKEYLQELIKWRHDNLIKVITGIRRCGKSTLLSQYEEYLLSQGVEKSQIISINFEDLKNEELLDYKSLYTYIYNKLVDGKWTYVLLDEIQNVKQFQKTIDSLYVQKNVDIYITGSNAYLLSSNLATLLSGRYVEISMLPFSFKEYYQANMNLDKETAFANYLKFGGFPYSSTLDLKQDKINQYLEGIFNTIIIKDIEDRKLFDFKNSQTIDVVLLKQICTYLADVVGNPVSIKSISDFLCSNNRKISDHTVSYYMNALVEAYIFYPVDRYNIRGKELLKTNKKYYIVDTGIKNYLLTKASSDLGYLIENIVYLELERRGYKINTGKLQTKEIDFISTKNGSKQYYQVSVSLTDSSTFEREILPLKMIKDNYRKIILTLDKFTCGNYDGIEVNNLIDWLLD